MSRHKEVRGIFEKIPSVAKGSFIAPTATVVGSVKIGANSNVWYGAVVKGDSSKVTIGENTNIRESAIVSTSKTDGTITIGNGVSVGAGAKIGAAVLEDNSSVGAGANIADGVHIHKGGAVADGALVLAQPSRAARSEELDPHANIPYRFHFCFLNSIWCVCCGLVPSQPEFGMFIYSSLRGRRPSSCATSRQRRLLHCPRPPHRSPSSLQSTSASSTRY